MAEAAPDPLREVFEAVSAAEGPVAKFNALKKSAAELAIPLRHGLLDYYEIEERLIDLAHSHGLIDELTLGTVELAVTQALSTPPLSVDESKQVNGHELEPPPVRGPEDYGLEQDNATAGRALIVAPPRLLPITLESLPLKIEDWLGRDLSEPDRIMGSWLTTTSRTLLVAPTGLGKTNFAMALAMHVAAGKDFLHWRAHRRCKVLYIDGEMSRRLLKQRIAEAAARLGENPEGFYALSHEDIEGFPPLNTAAGQGCLDQIIEYIGGVDLVAFDSIMCLLAGDMKEGEPWAQVMPWVRSLTKRNIAQIWNHHTGHDTTRSYGDKTKEWQLDTVLHMETVENAAADVSFSLEFRMRANVHRQPAPTSRRSKSR